ncbi:12039_t:CDS:2, partial [Acaulospora colombiana]
MTGNDVRDIFELNSVKTSNDGSSAPIKKTSKPEREKKPGNWFAEYNKDTEVLEYNEEEYQKFLTDKEWTKEETDYLFSLCRKYDLRFIVIHDRYEYSERSMEEEESLLEEYERIEQNEKKFAKERENLMKLLNFQEVVQQKRKKSLLSGPTTPTTEVVHSPIEVHATPTTARREKFPQGVVVRSQRIPSPKQAMAAKVQKTLQEFGLGPRPTIPTENVCGRWTELQKAIQTLLEIKKGVDKQEHELKAKINLYKKITSGTEGNNGSKASTVGGNGAGTAKKSDAEKTTTETSTP